jgi:hypothetical protein
MKLRRLIFGVLLVIGVALIAAPLSMSMFSRSSNGEAMVNGFRPIMQPAHVQTTADYYYNVFAKLRPFALAMPGVQADAQKLVPALAQALHMTPTQVEQMLATQFPSLAKLLQSLPQAVPVFKRVPPGLDFYKSLVTTMQANVTNYASVDAMPRMSLFPWFFVAPGILVLLLAGYGLLAEWKPGTFHLPSFHHRPLPH